MYAVENGNQIDIMNKLLYVFLLFLLCSCATSRRVEHENHNTTIQNYKHDSFFLHDSVCVYDSFFTKTRNDTVFQIDRSRRDYYHQLQTVRTHDSIVFVTDTLKILTSPKSKPFYKNGSFWSLFDITLFLILLIFFTIKYCQKVHGKGVLPF